MFEIKLSQGAKPGKGGMLPGGTGAAPMPLIDDVGLPLRESLLLVVDKLTKYGLRDRVRVIASGKLELEKPARV